LALHELLSEPAGDPADNDGCDPADLMLFHWRFLPAGDSRTNRNVILARCPTDFDGLARPLLSERTHRARIGLRRLAREQAE
jgi:hypothetical protein